ncbi:MAG: 2-hydroxyglutaryl-CoA dehydratase [bacterium]|nr:2-hydroxyglutaryl-CoA dehydratase [bacterium]
MNIVAGVDLGSATTKAVVLEDSTILGHAVLPTGSGIKNPALRVLEMACEKANIPRTDISKIVATGYGRIKADFADKAITEITCHGVGAQWLNPDVEAIIDIGGQDSKGIKLSSDGEILDFVMNDKCAAGTGRFIELVSHCLELNLDEVGSISLNAKDPKTISSMCAVFAESEVVSLIADGASHADILAGVHQAIARRVISMASRIGLENSVICFTGGVAKNRGMKLALENETGKDIIIPEEPQIVGALGAAVLAKKLLKK